MNIVHVGEYVSGGVATYLRTLVELQVKDPSIDHIILFMSDFKSDQICFESPKVSVIRYNYHRSVIGMIQLQRLWKRILSFNPDIIHLHSSFSGLLRIHMLFKKIRHPKYKVVYCSHGWAFTRDDSQWKNNVLSFIEKFLSLGCDKIINISQSEESAARRFGISSQKMVLIKNGIRTDQVVPEFHRNKSNETVLFVGRFDRQKGVDVLLKATKQLPNIKFRLAGAPVVGSEEIAQEIPSNVELLGWLSPSAVSEEMSNADAVIIPSRWEGFGLVALEAMLHHSAVIASRVGGLSELIEDGVNGYLIKPNDVSAIVSILKRTGRNELARLGQNGYFRVCERYDANAMVKKIDNLYLQLLRIR